MTGIIHLAYQTNLSIAEERSTFLQSASCNVVPTDLTARGKVAMH